MPDRPSEFEFIARYLAPLAGEGAFGLTDDAAALAPPAGHDLVLSKDMLSAGTHFFPDDPPGAIARKALRVNLSDLAGKGAKPFGFMLGLALPDDWAEPWLAEFCDGLKQDCEHYGVPLLGGDTVGTRGVLAISITVLGLVPAGTMLRRTAARPGDRIFVSGTIGDAALGLKARLDPQAAWLAALPPVARSFLLERYLLPRPRLALAESARRHARAGMDVSDGFVGDLGKMLPAAGAGVGTTIALDKVPLSDAAIAAVAAAPELLEVALTGGDDYELLLAIPAGEVEPFRAAARQAGVPVTEVGTVTADPAIHFMAADGAERAFAHGSYLHF
jgi:thiamine-monophosphate kinase